MKTKVKVAGPAARETVTGGLGGLGTGTDIQPVKENQPETDLSKDPQPTAKEAGCAMWRERQISAQMGLGARVALGGNMKLDLPNTQMDSRPTKGRNVVGRSGELCGHRNSR